MSRPLFHGRTERALLIGFGVFLALLLLRVLVPEPPPEQNQAALQPRIQAATLACGARVGILTDRPVSVAQLEALEACMRRWFADQRLPYSQ
jgi:hypothetical protein